MSTSILYQTLVFLVFIVAYGQSLSFNIPHFDGSTQNITYANNSSFASGGEIQLTISTININPSGSVGRASYSQPMRLWDKTTNKTANFSTHFSFGISTIYNDPNIHGDGMAFFLAPFDDSTAYAPENSYGGSLGLLNFNITNYPFVAVEFDTYHNFFDPDDDNDDHLGIDVSSVISNTSVNLGTYLRNNSGSAWITYDSSTMNLSVHLTDLVRPLQDVQPSLSYIIDLRSILPERVRVGFSAATGASVELHSISSWNFSSTLPDTEVRVHEPPGEIQHKNGTEVSVPIVSTQPVTKKKSNAALLGGLVAGFSVITLGLGSLVFLWWRRRSRARNDNIRSEMDDYFNQETGPRRFTYNELSHATNNFHEERKLGEGGFGGVYKGFLTDISKFIAVKKIERGSEQGRKEFVSEVKIISSLRHKHLVKLLGWCHEQGELLLVYEYMPKGSLDSHLYRSYNMNTILPWAERYKIARGLAYALLYLHEEWEQCVLHRDIKPSNVMLDANFNAKLGDFGLARLVDHNLGSQTTVLAGTLGYLAPECVLKGKATKESDVYSFGVVALEIACGRRPIEPNEESSRVRLIEWVCALYEEGRLQEAVDDRLEKEANTKEMECLMIVGLWCCHQEYTSRPSMRQAINVLNFECPLPSLPSKFPVPANSSSPMNSGTLYIISSPSTGAISSSSGTISSSSLTTKSVAAHLQV